jgi:hypothetical protein
LGICLPNSLHYFNLQESSFAELKAFAAAAKSGDQEQTYCIVRSRSTSQIRMADAPYASYEVYIAQ